MHVLKVDHPTTHAWHDSLHSLTKIIANNMYILVMTVKKKRVLKEEEEEDEEEGEEEEGEKGKKYSTNEKGTEMLHDDRLPIVLPATPQLVS